MAARPVRLSRSMAINKKIFEEYKPEQLSNDLATEVAMDEPTVVREPD